MDDHPIVIPAILAFVLCYLFCGAFGWLAARIGFTDRPNGAHKKHKKATPLLGGAAVLCSLALVICTIPIPLDPQSKLILATTVSMAILGLVDDRWSLAPRAKFAGQVLICLPAAFVGFPLAAVETFGWEFALGSFAPLFVLLWLTSCTNAFNLLDGLDGVAGLVGISICAALVGTALFQPDAQTLGIGVSLWLAASLLGFLVHNWFPARLYLGDGGSLPVGLLLGMLALKIETTSLLILNLTGVLLIFAVPLGDMILAMTRRSLTGRSIATPDNQHLHHRLHGYGLSVPQSAAVAFLLALGCGSASVYATATGRDFLAWTFCVAVFAGMAMLGLFGDIETRLVWNALRQWATPSRPRLANHTPWVLANLKSSFPNPPSAENVSAVHCLVQTSSGAHARIHVLVEADELSDRDTNRCADALKSIPRHLLAIPAHRPLEQNPDLLRPVTIPIVNQHAQPEEQERPAA